MQLTTAESLTAVYYSPEGHKLCKALKRRRERINTLNRRAARSFKRRGIRGGS